MPWIFVLLINLSSNNTPRSYLKMFRYSFAVNDYKHKGKRASIDFEIIGSNLSICVEIPNVCKNINFNILLNEQWNTSIVFERWIELLKKKFFSWDLELEGSTIQKEEDSLLKNDPFSKIKSYIESKRLIVKWPSKDYLERNARSKLLDRADIISKITKEVSNQIERFRGEIDYINFKREDFPIFVCSGATGIGKTELLKEIRYIYFEGNHLHKSIHPVFISFNSSQSYSKIEGQYDMEKVIAARCLESLGTVKSGNLLDAYDTDNLRLTSIFPDPNKCVLLLIDEFKKLEDHGRLTEFVDFCGAILSPKENRSLLIIITAGTIAGKINQIFRESRYFSISFSIPPLQLSSMMKDLTNRISDPEHLKEIYKVLQDISGIPRLYNVIKKEKNLTRTCKEIDILLSKASFPQRDHIPVSELNKIVAYSFLEWPVSALDPFWDQYTKCGQAFLFPSDIDGEMLVRFPMYWVDYSSKYYSNLPLNIKRLLSRLYLDSFDSSSGNEFENLAAQLISFKTFLFFEINDKSLLGNTILLSKYICVEVERHDFILVVDPIPLLKTNLKISRNGFKNLKYYAGYKTAEIQKDAPFIVACASNQDGIDCVQLLISESMEPILIFYQFKNYNSASACKSSLEKSLENSVVPIKLLVSWYEKTFYIKIYRQLYIALVNNCNLINFPLKFHELVKNGLEFYFVEGPRFKKFMTSIICARNEVLSRNDRLLINVASPSAMKMLPDIGEDAVERILQVRNRVIIKSLQHLEEELKNNIPPFILNMSLRRTLETNFIW
eukprot:NODE_228_length_12276_cov_0.305337.p1 type:complete len:782 gc:universal NODE_228_length_12276_cov_0.305337:3291-946(-)